MADYFSFGNRQRGTSSASQNPPRTPATPGGRPPRPAGSRETLRAPSSIRIRRMPSGTPAQTPRPTSQASNEGIDVHDTAVTGRRRSSSAPQRNNANLAPYDDRLSRIATAQPTHMGTITEGQRLPQTQSTSFYDGAETPGRLTPSSNAQTQDRGSGVDWMASTVPAVENAGEAAQRNRGLRRFRTNDGRSRGFGHGPLADDEYDTDMVDLLDLIGGWHMTMGRTLSRR